MKYLGVGLSGSKLVFEGTIIKNFRNACGDLWRVTKSVSCKTRTIIMKAYLDSVVRYQIGPAVMTGMVSREFVESLETMMYRRAY
jgi:hypothetical protein